MDILRGERKSGKTTEIINIAWRTDATVLCFNRDFENMIRRQAEKMGYKKIKTKTLDAFMNHQNDGIRNIVIDEVGMLLQHLCGGANILAATTSDKVFDINNVLKVDEYMSCNMPAKLEKYKRDNKFETLLCKLTLDDREFKEVARMSKAKKPPLGIMPNFIWKLKRKEELKAAIERYIDAGLKVNTKWIEEYNAYVKEDIKYEF